MNGTLVNGVRILNDVAELKQDDIITVCPLPGNATVAFRLQINGHQEPAANTGNAVNSSDSTLPIDSGEFVEPAQPAAQPAAQESTVSSSPPPTKRTRTEPPAEETSSISSAPLIESSPEVAVSGTVSTVNKPDVAASSSTAAAAALDPIEANLNCSICCEIFHDCVTLIPCLHGYCAGCYSEWRRTNPVCPQCRVRPDRVTKNALVTNLAEAFLALHPDRRRPKDELDRLDKLNNIGREEAFPAARVRQSPAAEDEYDEGNDSEEGDDDEDDYDHGGHGYVGVFGAFAGQNQAFAVHALHRIATPPHLRHVCRQCPGYQAARPQPPAPHQQQQQQPDGCPHFDDLRWEPLQVAHVCPDNQAHLLCQCCWQAFPDRRADQACPPENRRFQCGLCQRFFCHAYWGCRRPGCLGCLAEFEDFTFGRRVLEDVVNGNQVESKILTDYLLANDLGVRDLLRECCVRLASGDWTCSRPVQPDTPVCYSCGLACLRELALAYRCELQANALPAELANRPNCHWGSECRTQFNKPDHARRYNHACPRTRYS